MRALILTTAVLIAALTMAARSEAAGPSPHHANIGHGSDHGATVTLAAHHGHHGGHGYSHHGPPHHSYRHYEPRHHYYPHGCHPPVIVRPPVVVPYPAYRYYPYGYYGGYSYHQGGMSINTGRVGFSIAF